MAKVLHLFRSPGKRAPMSEVPEIVAIADLGFKGCAHGRRSGRRQVLLMASERLAEFGLARGIVKENITTEGLDVDALDPGQHLRVGGALLEVAVPCEPCEQMEKIREGLRVALKGKRGTLCKVINGGMIRQGDTIEVIEIAMRSRLENGTLPMSES